MGQSSWEEEEKKRQTFFYRIRSADLSYLWLPFSPSLNFDDERQFVSFFFCLRLHAYAFSLISLFEWVQWLFLQDEREQNWASKQEKEGERESRLWLWWLGESDSLRDCKATRRHLKLLPSFNDRLLDSWWLPFTFLLTSFAFPSLISASCPNVLAHNNLYLTHR